MALIARDKLSELVSATVAKSTADTAVDEINLQQIAYAINSAANTGQKEVVIITLPTTSTLSKLEAKGYKVSYKKSGADTTIVVSWGDA